MAYLTEDERKKTLKHICNHFEFTSCVDLLQVVKIRPLSLTTKNLSSEIAAKLVAADVALFTAWWMIAFHEQLNGFSGFGAIKWDLEL